MSGIQDYINAKKNYGGTSTIDDYKMVKENCGKLEIERCGGYSYESYKDGSTRKCDMCGRSMINGNKYNGMAVCDDCYCNDNW